MSLTEGIDYRVARFRVTRGFLCENDCVHFNCPHCGRTGSVQLSAGNLTGLFSVECANDGNLFLIDWRESERLTLHAEAPQPQA
jgi:hypothetical protein